MRITILILIICCGFTAESQQLSEIKVIHRVRNDSIILRWAPTTAVAWQIANQNGYKVFRYEINNSNDTLRTEKILLAENIKPWPLDDWEPLAAQNNYAAIAAQAIYGNDFEVSDPTDNTADFYNQVTEQQNRFGFALYAADMSLKVAEAMGLSVVDKNFDPETRYAYKVMLQKNHLDYEVQSGVTVVNAMEPQVLPEPTDPKVMFGDREVKITWDSFFDQGIYIAYKVERSEDGGQTFTARSQVPFTTVNRRGEVQRRIHYLDSLEQNYKLYAYRIRGITSFGETGPPSQLLAGTGTGSARGVTANIDTAFIRNDGAAFLRWNFPEHLKGNILGFVICNSSKSRGPFLEISNILSPDKHSYIDKQPNSVNYYAVRVVGKDSVTTTSLPVLLQPPDSIGPSTPYGFKAEADTLGNIYLDWLPSPEQDVAGYRIFRANGPQDEFVQITSSAVKFSEFIDKIELNKLTEDIYYKIAAVDQRDNFSAFSKALRVSKPDVVPPVAPVFQSYVSEEGHITLQWVNSISNDVVGHDLERIDEEGNRTLIDLQAEQQFYQDNDVVPGQSYIYKLQAKDDSGLYSDATEIRVEAVSIGIKPPVEKLKARADKAAKKILLTWNYTYPDVERFIIYRKKNDEPLRIYREVEGGNNSFTDNFLLINNTYQYQVQAVYKNDDESELSKVVKVVY